MLFWAVFESHARPHSLLLRMAWQAQPVNAAFSLPGCIAATGQNGQWAGIPAQQKLHMRRSVKRCSVCAGGVRS